MEGRERVEQDRAGVFIYCSPPALMARDQLALLNWALNTHTAALKLPDA